MSSLSFLCGSRHSETHRIVGACNENKALEGESVQVLCVRREQNQRLVEAARKLEMHKQSFRIRGKGVASAANMSTGSSADWHKGVCVAKHMWFTGLLIMDEATKS